MYERLREGRQRVVFTSPEALTRTLGRVLEQVAESGRLGQFVDRRGPHGRGLGR